MKGKGQLELKAKGRFLCPLELAYLTCVALPPFSGPLWSFPCFHSAYHILGLSFLVGTLRESYSP